MVALVLLASAWETRTAGADATAALRIQLKWSHQFQFAGYYAALHRGYFRDAGLAVTLLEGGPGIRHLERVLGGAAEFGVGTSELVVARSQGQPVEAVAAIFQHSPYVLVARNPDQFQTPADLEGRTIMGSRSALELRAFLHREGVDLERVHSVPHSGNPLDIYGADIVATAAYSTSVRLILERQDRPYRIFDPMTTGLDFYGDTLYTTETFAARNNATVVAVRDAVIQGWQYALQHPDAVSALIEREYGVPDDPAALRFQAREVRRLLAPDLVGVGYMTHDRWRRIADVFRDAGLLEGPVDIDDFLFQPALPINWSRLLYPLLAVLTLMLLVAGSGMYYFALNRRLAAEAQRRKGLEAELRAQAVTDFGTGVYNRRGFFDTVNRALSRARRADVTLALLAIDLDHFKHVNDAYGHAVGDRALTLVADALRGSVRGSDVVGRVGGEEFMVMLPDTDSAGARATAARILASIRAVDLSPETGHAVRLSASIGLIERAPDETLDAMMQRADALMYRAKKQGGDRIVQEPDATNRSDPHPTDSVRPTPRHP